VGTDVATCGEAGQSFCAPLEGVSNSNTSYSNGFGAFNRADNHMYHTGLDLVPPTSGGVVGPVVYAAASGCLVDAIGLADQGGGRENFWVWKDDGNGVYDFFPNGRIDKSGQDSPEAELFDGRKTIDNHGLGMHVILRHQDINGSGEIFTLYGHLHAITREIYDAAIKKKPATLCFEARHVIGVMGHSAFKNRRDPSFGAHVHFEVKSSPKTGSSFAESSLPNGYFGYTPDLPRTYGYRDPWTYVYYPEGSPTVQSFAIAVDCDETASTQQECSDQNTDNGVRVYAGPGVNYSVLGWTGKGQQFAVDATVASTGPGDAVVPGRTWYRIDLPNRAGASKGWVPSVRSNGVQLTHTVIDYTLATVTAANQELLLNLLDPPSFVVVWDNLAKSFRRVRIWQGQKLVVKSISADGNFCELHVPKFYFVHPNEETVQAPPIDNVVGKIETVWVPCSSLQIQAASSAPVVNAGPDERTLTGLLYPLNWSFTDANHDGPWSYTIDWGDGSTSTGSVANEGSHSDGHTYIVLLQRNLTITVTVTDASGSSGSDSKVVTVFVL